MSLNLHPQDSSQVPPQSIFLDTLDRRVKYKDIDNSLYYINMIPESNPAPAPRVNVNPVTLNIKDKSGFSGNVYFSIIGYQNDQWNVNPLIRQWSYMDANGNPQVCASGQNWADYFQPLTSGTYSGNLPFFFSGRVTFCFGEPPAYFEITTPSGLPMPSMTDVSDAWWYTINDKIEFTNKNKALGADVTTLDCNTTLVDGFGVPIVLAISGNQMGYQSAGSLAVSRESAFKEFSGLSVAYTDQIVLSTGTSGDTYVRILSPQTAMSRVSGTGPEFPEGLMRNYIDEVWDYFSQPGNYFNVKLDAYAGFPYGTTTSGNIVAGVFTFADPGNTGNLFTIDKPSTFDLLGCQGVFNVTNPVNGTWDGNIKVAVAGAMNRGVATSGQICNPDGFYTGAVHNEYAKTVHNVSVNRINYAFPYDDACNLYSSNMADSTPYGMSIELQPWYIDIC